MRLRVFVATVLLTITLPSAADEPKQQPPLPITGLEQAELAGLDRWMIDFMTRHKIPGGSLAIAKDGRLVFARGFGYADRENKTPVQPASLFRIASVSKPITAVAIMQLVDRGKLMLSDKIVDILPIEPHLEEGGRLDPRWQDVTVQHCLTHTGGWDRGKSYDPMFVAPRMAQSMGVELPIRQHHIIRYMRGQPLDFDPGERYAYSNFGYCLLGRVIEQLTDQPYERYMRQQVLAPLGIRTARIGGSLESQRFDGEVRYYDANNATGLAIVGPGAGQRQVPISYGVWRQETLDSHGGWIASTTDLVRFAAALDSAEGKLLSRRSLRAMFDHHAEIDKADDQRSAVSYGYGWFVSQDADGRPIARHGGSLACTCALLARLPGEVNVAVLFNLGRTADGRFLGRLVSGPFIAAVGAIDRWPEHDLFEE